MSLEGRIRKVEIELEAMSKASAKRDLDLALVMAVALDEVVRAGGANRDVLIASLSSLDRRPVETSDLSRPRLFAEHIAKALAVLARDGDTPPH